MIPLWASIHDTTVRPGLSSRARATRWVRRQTTRARRSDSSGPRCLKYPVTRSHANSDGAGVVHRGLKPSNVLLTTDGTPKITDFGLARRLESTDGVTRTGTVMGTPSYMPPEQARGDLRGVGQAGDVYALGAVLYELL